MTTHLCMNCEKALNADDEFCPKCGTPTSTTRSDSPTVLKDPELKAPTYYGSPTYGMPQQNPYESPNPFDVSPKAPPPPARRRGMIMPLVVVAILIIAVGGGLIYYTAVFLPQAHSQASATAQAIALSTAQAQATSTARAQATGTAQANATATAVAQANATAIAMGPPIGFSVDGTTLHNGQVVKQNAAFTISGTYSVEGSGLVWVVLQDSRRQFYLQNPPVQFNDDKTWTATNITPGKGITKVNFVYVTSQGNQVFQQKVANGDFGAFSTLPAGSKTLQTISIVVSP